VQRLVMTVVDGGLVEGFRIGLFGLGGLY